MINISKLNNFKKTIGNRLCYNIIANEEARECSVYRIGEYIGIAFDEKVRFKQHTTSESIVGEKIRELNLTIKNLEVIYKGTRAMCNALERYLRPEINMGWNRAKGGGGGANEGDLTKYEFWHPKHGKRTCTKAELVEDFRLLKEKMGNLVSETEPSVRQWRLFKNKDKPRKSPGITGKTWWRHDTNGYIKESLNGLVKMFPADKLDVRNLAHTREGRRSHHKGWKSV